MFCNIYNAKCLFWLLKAFHFGIKNQSKEHEFSKTASWTLFLMSLYRFYSKMFDCGTPSKSSGRQNLPTPAGVRRCQISEYRISHNGHNLSLVTQPGLWHSPKSSPFSSLDPGSSISDRTAPNLICWVFWPAFCHHQTNQKNKLAKIRRNLKKPNLGRQRLQF